MKKHDFCIPDTNTIAKPFAEVIGSTGGGGGRFLYQDSGIPCPSNKPINISVTNTGNTGNPFVNWTGSNTNFGGNTGNTGNPNTNSIFNMPNMNIPSNASTGNLDGNYNLSNDSVKVITRYQNLMKGFTGQVLGGANHDQRHCRDYSEKPQVNKEMLAAVRKIDRDNNAQAINFILFHNHYLNDDDMYWLSATFNYHGPKGLAVNTVDLSNNCLTLVRDSNLEYVDLPFFSFNAPYNTPRNILRLDLSNNQIGDAGAKVVADGLANGVFPITKQINLSGNNITKEGDTKLVQALKGKVQDMVIVTQKLGQNLKMIGGSKEEKIAIYKEFIQKAAECGTYDKGIVVDKSLWGEIKNTANKFTASGHGVVGFVKCNWKPEDMVKTYAQDKITAKFSKTLSKILGKFTDIEGVVSCYLEATDSAWTSEEGIKAVQHELCVLGEQEFCGE